MTRCILSTLPAMAGLLVACVSAALSANGYQNTRAEGPVAVHTSSGALPLTHFYDVPVPLPPGKPGDLIRAEPFHEYRFGIDASAMRILYHSVSAAGEDVASSGVLVVPDGTPPSGGWPIIAWAHSVLATARSCAPSLTRGLRNGPVLSMYVNLGYAVVASDYVGLGTPFRNAGMDLPSNATDVINSVTAARLASPNLRAKWIAIGEADGGAAALMVAELEASTHDAGYSGSIAISETLDVAEAINRLPRQAWDDRLALLAYAIKTVYRQFQIDEIFTPKGVARYEAVNQTCIAPPLEKPSALSEMLKAGWEGNSFVRGFLTRNTVGAKPARAPLLIISISPRDDKGADPTTARVVNRMCAQKDRVDFQAYPNVDNNALIGVSVSSQISWIKARFAGATAPDTCF